MTFRQFFHKTRLHFYAFYVALGMLLNILYYLVFPDFAEGLLYLILEAFVTSVPVALLLYELSVHRTQSNKDDDGSAKLPE